MDFYTAADQNVSLHKITPAQITIEDVEQRENLETKLNQIKTGVW